MSNISDRVLGLFIIAAATLLLFLFGWTWDVIAKSPPWASPDDWGIWTTYFRCIYVEGQCIGLRRSFDPIINAPLLSTLAFGASFGLYYVGIKLLVTAKL